MQAGLGTWSLKSRRGRGWDVLGVHTSLPVGVDRAVLQIKPNTALLEAGIITIPHP